MKHFLFIISLVFVQLSGFSQNSSIPYPIQQAMADKYPSAEKINCLNTSGGIFEVGFVSEKVDHIANFDITGSWLQTRSYLKPKQLPKEIKEIIFKDYEMMNVEEVEKMETIGTHRVYRTQGTMGLYAITLWVHKKYGIIHEQKILQDFIAWPVDDMAWDDPD